MASEKQQPEPELFQEHELPQLQPQEASQTSSPAAPTRTTTTTTTISLTTSTTASLAKGPITITITPLPPSSSSHPPSSSPPFCPHSPSPFPSASHETLSLSPVEASTAASLVVAAAQLAAGLLLLGYGLAARNEDVCFAGWMCGLLTTGLLAALLLRERGDDENRGSEGGGDERRIRSGSGSSRWRPLIVASVGELFLLVDALVSGRWWRGAAAAAVSAAEVGGIHGGVGGRDAFVYYRLGLAALVVFWGGFALEMVADAIFGSRFKGFLTQRARILLF
ncbi:hypothetical protein F4810DRAFT_649502 [Camillea tinctor]|nr:hypothetical protein F4810DRAFT_649502 [Camillea tinctor]